MSLEIKNVTKFYGQKQALDNVSINFDKGIYGLLGPNGAGKSTLLNIMVTALKPTSGEILFNGKDIFSQKKNYLSHLGFMPQTPGYYKNYTAEEFLRYVSALKNVKSEREKKIKELLSFVNLSSEAKNKVGTFSGGMKQRLGIACALLNDPEIIILDEPTAGLDPMERIRLRNLLSEISENRTLIVATHIVSDMEFIANNIILLKNGEVCRNGSPKELCDELENKVFLIDTSPDELEEFVRKYNVSSVLNEGDKYTMRIVSDNLPSEKAKTVTPILEDVFLLHFGKINF